MKTYWISFYFKKNSIIAIDVSGIKIVSINLETEEEDTWMNLSFKSTAKAFQKIVSFLENESGVYDINSDED